jgi:hypothetical protein
MKSERNIKLYGDFFRRKKEKKKKKKQSIIVKGYTLESSVRPSPTAPYSNTFKV